MATPAPQRSVFVTNLAWLVMVLGGLSTLGVLLQLVGTAVIAFALPAQAGGAAPPSSGNWISYFFYAAYLAASGLLLAAGMALLRRRNWARRVVLGYVAFSGLACLFFVLFGILFGVLALAGGGEGLAGFAIGAFFAIVFLGGSAAAAALLWWVARRLRSVETRREFGAA
jgi:hypothetical protein